MAVEVMAWMSNYIPLFYMDVTTYPCPIHDTSLQWRHNWRDSVSNHQPHDCLLNRLFRRRSKKHQSSASLAFVRGIHRGPVNSPHKWPVTRKMFPYDDVIIYTVYPVNSVHWFVVLCFVVVAFHSCGLFTYISQGFYIGTSAISRLPL